MERAVAVIAPHRERSPDDASPWATVTIAAATRYGRKRLVEVAKKRVWSRKILSEGLTAETGQ